MKRKRRTCRRRRAFTLLEVLMVVVIIGILAALVVPNFFHTQRDAERRLTKALIDSGINGALNLYRLHMGHFPREDEGGLAALVERPDDEELQEKWAGPYVDDVSKLKDTWGNELIYRCPGEVNEDSFDLASPGPDGQEGTDDDIMNWKRT